MSGDINLTEYIKTNLLRGQFTELESRYLIQQLFYETGTDHPSYNGNISAMKWRTFGFDKGAQYWCYDYIRKLTRKGPIALGDHPVYDWVDRLHSEF